MFASPLLGLRQFSNSLLSDINGVDDEMKVKERKRGLEINLSDNINHVRNSPFLSTPTASLRSHLYMISEDLLRGADI